MNWKRFTIAALACKAILSCVVLLAGIEDFGVKITPPGKYIYKIPDALDTENWVVFVEVKNNEEKPLILKNVKFDIYSGEKIVSSIINYYNQNIKPDSVYKLSMLFFREKVSMNSDKMTISINTDKGVENKDVFLKRYKQPIKIYLPLKGVWQITSAFGFGVSHRRWDNRSQFAYDFDKIDGNGSLYHGNDKNDLNSYYAFGESVFAPADCTVIKAHDGEKDNPIGTVTKHANYVLLDFGHNIYCNMAHFKYGSVLVKSGQKLKKGIKIAEVGNSGMSDNPHLHINLQYYDKSSGEPLKPGNPLPLSFSNVFVHPTYLNRWVAEDECYPNSGYFIKSR